MGLTRATLQRGMGLMELLLAVVLGMALLVGLGRLLAHSLPLQQSLVAQAARQEHQAPQEERRHEEDLPAHAQYAAARPGAVEPHETAQHDAEPA